MSYREMEHAGGDIRVLTGTTSSTVDSSVSVALPTGFTSSNTVIIGLQLEVGGQWRAYGTYTTAVPVVATAMLSGSNAYVTTRQASAGGIPFKITVYKYE